MSLRDDLNALEARRPLRFTDWLKLNQDSADGKLVREYLEDLSVSPNALAETLRANRVPVTRESIIAYRNNHVAR